MCVCIYISIYIHNYIYLHIYMYTYICIKIYICVHRSTSIGDDYAAMHEVISRRFRDIGAAEQGASSDDWPDVVLIDGGKGQLAAALDGLDSAEAPSYFKQRFCAIAKKREEIFVPDRTQPLQSDADQPALLLLRGLRDEAHRFAVSKHRRRRSKALFK